MFQKRVKRRRTGMHSPNDVGNDNLELQHEELKRMAQEVEPVTVKRPDQTTIVGYRPTYRAVLARRAYLVQDTLGSGSYSKVRKALSFQDGEPSLVAIKIIDRQKAPKDYQEKFMPRELELWPRMHHPHLIQLTECFQDSRRVFMVLEYADGGDALKYIQTSGAISESMSQTWIAQICDAVRYMHDIDIAHRDLKLENILIDNDKNIKICDFGFVKEASGSHELSKTYCGSKSYAAPEILMGRPYDPRKADIWAIGVILYIFVTGKMPFDETKGTKSILEEQRALAFRWPKTRKVSQQCQNLVRRMFTWEFLERPNIYSVVLDFWFHDPSIGVGESTSPRRRIGADLALRSLAGAAAAAIKPTTTVRTAGHSSHRRSSAGVPKTSFSETETGVAATSTPHG